MPHLLRSEMRAPLLTCLALTALTLSQEACVQLVAFEQPVVGQPDVIPSPERGDLVCDETVQVGARAMCDVSCTVETGDTEATCEGRLVPSGDGFDLDVSGLFEVEVTVTACGPLTAPSRVRSETGAGVRLEGRTAYIVDANDVPGAEQQRFLPDEDCGDRTILFQDGRLELVEPGRRWCATTLPRFSDGPWHITAPGGGVSSFELCLRTAEDG